MNESLENSQKLVALGGIQRGRKYLCGCQIIPLLSGLESDDDPNMVRRLVVGVRTELWERSDS